MANLAIKGHPTKGNEVIKILEMLGGVNFNNHDGCRNMLYFISTNECEIMADFIANNPLYNIYTLETFLEKNPYKVGDKVMINADINDVYTIKSMTWDADLERVVYRIEAIDGIEDNHFWFADEMVRYLEQKEETMEEKKSAGDMKQHLVEVSEMKTDKCFLDWRETDNCLNCKHFVALVKTKDGKWKVLCETKKSATE
jgi:hypothetical protein